MKKLKTPALFALALVIPAVIGGYFTILYQIDYMAPELMAEAMAQMGGKNAVVAIYIVQTLIYALLCGFLGCFMAQALGLYRPVRFEKKPLIRTLVLSLVFGILFSLDYWTFGAWIPGLREATDNTLNAVVLLSSVLYGGIIEEVMLRLFFMSLIALLLWKIFFSRHAQVPTAVLAAANILAAILFAAGHLPATGMLLGTLTPLLLVRCFLLNGGYGLFFGWLYRKYGIQYSMLAHALLHIVSKLIWAVFARG